MPISMMSRLHLTPLFLLPVLAVPVPPASAQSALAQSAMAGEQAPVGQVALTVTNAHEAMGDLRAAVYDNEEAFEDAGTPVAALVLRLSRPDARFSFGPLPPGRYAVRVFQDINRNGKIDRTMLGIPEEPFGFSNDAMGTMGPPTFEKAAVTIGEGTTELSIRLNR